MSGNIPFTQAALDCLIFIFTHPAYLVLLAGIGIAVILFLIVILWALMFSNIDLGEEACEGTVE